MPTYDEWINNNGWGEEPMFFNNNKSAQTEPLNLTDFHHIPPKEPVDLTGDDQWSVAVREIAAELDITPEELVDKPFAWLYLTEAVLGWFPGTHWQSREEFDDHNHYRRERILGPLHNLLNIKKKK